MNETPLPRPCPVCGEDEASVVWTKESLRVVRCGGCAMLYANPVSPEFASGTFYDEQKFYLSPAKLEGDYAPVRFARELKIFRAHCTKGRVLDVGCSTGAFLFQLQKRFPGSYETVGTDVAGAALDYAAGRGVRVRRESFLDFDFASERFDAVTFWAVIEHLAAPDKFLAKAAALLKPGGHCFILVPNARSLAVRLLGAKYRYIMPDHLNYFTAATLRRFAEGTGAFDLVASGSTHFNPIVICQDWRGGAHRVPDEARAALLQRTTAMKQRPLLRPLRPIYNATEWLLGKLNLADNLFIVLRRR